MYRCFVLMETVNHSYSVPAFSFTQTNAAEFFWRHIIWILQMFNLTREKRVHRNICQKIKRADNFDIQTAFSLRLPRLRPLLADCYATQRFFHTPDRMENIRPCFVFKKSQFQTMHLGLTFLKGEFSPTKRGSKFLFL